MNKSELPILPMKLKWFFRKKNWGFEEQIGRRAVAHNLIEQIDETLRSFSL